MVFKWVYLIKKYPFRNGENNMKSVWALWVLFLYNFCWKLNENNQTKSIFVPINVHVSSLYFKTKLCDVISNFRNLKILKIVNFVFW